MRHPDGLNTAKPQRSFAVASTGVRVIALAGSFSVLFPSAIPADPRSDAAADQEHLAQVAIDRGDAKEAVIRWREAVQADVRAKDLGREVDAMIQLAGAYQSTGQIRLGEETLDEAHALAFKGGDQARLAATENARGALRTFSHKARFAEDDLNHALKLAREQKDRGLEAAAENNLGILFSAQKNYEKAEDAFRAAEGLSDDPLLSVKVKANRAENACRAGEYSRAEVLANQAASAADHLEDSHDKAFCLMRAGKLLEMLFEAAPEHRQRLRLTALELHEHAARIARKLDDRAALSFALGYCGHLYEQEKKFDAASRLTEQAAFLAQELQAADLLYQWEWQAARLEAATGHREEAITTYRRAIQELDMAREGVSTRFGNEIAGGSYRERAGAIYFELADLLLQRADAMKSGEELQKCLEEARGACEMLKSVELEDYFQDDCVNLLKSKTKPIETISPNAAIVYLVPLRDRTEIVVSLNGHLQRVKSAVTSAELTATVREFRQNLEKQTTNEYLEQSRQIYSWLIRPLEPLLEKTKIDTLVFVPDGALRTIPMAALQDGTRFLIEKYALAVTPGLTLMEPAASHRRRMDMMTNALTQAVTRNGENFPALPYAGEEVSKLRAIYGGKTLVDETFVNRNLSATFEAEQFSVVHFASHGEFNGNSRDTFLLTYDSRLGLDDLERLIRPAQLRDQPLDMLSMSACQTAAGDDRAALGLAGVAVKAGARSAFATLWCVNDEASMQLVTDFYQALRSRPDLSKAQALRLAQLKLLSEPRTRHPCLWAPYLIIGNWL